MRIWLKAIIFLSIALLLYPSSARAEVFRKRINNTVLVIKAPGSYVWKGKRIFVDKKKEFGVEIEYGELKAQANQAAYDLQQEVIELSEGFRGSLEDYWVEGNYFRINPRTGHYAGYDLKFGYLVASFYGKEFQFYGDKIQVEKISASPLYFPVFRLYTEKLEIYPGYSLARQNTLKLFAIPFYYIPLYVDDERRSYFDLPFPAPEVQSDIFHGTHGALHSNYFISPSLYGDVSLRYSEEDGGGAHIQQLVRLSDHHQVELEVLGWEKAPAQAKFSYIFHFFDNPRRPGQELSFRKQQMLEEEIAKIPPRLTFQCDYTANEEIKRSIVDRYPDVSVSVPMRGILYDHTYAFIPSVHYGNIKEKKIYPEDSPPADVDRDYRRMKGDINFTYYVETPYLSPFINKVLLETNYEHSVYEPGSADRGRVEGSVIARRPILKALGLYYELVLTKNVLDYGQSPFFFEEYGRLKDNGTLDLYLQLPFLVAGNQLIYDFEGMQLYNEIYYAGIKSGDNYAVVQYDRRMESWEFAFMRKEPAF